MKSVVVPFLRNVAVLALITVALGLCYGRLAGFIPAEQPCDPNAGPTQLRCDQ